MQAPPQGDNHEKPALVTEQSQGKSLSHAVHMLQRLLTVIITIITFHASAGATHRNHATESKTALAAAKPESASTQAHSRC